MKSKSPRAVTKRKGPTNALETPVTSSSQGVRSSPISVPWDNKASETISKIRDRVRKSRAIQETLPFVKYMNTAIPEEALSGGLTPKSISKMPEFRKAATDLFWQWADSEAIDVRKRFDFYTMQPMLGTTTLGDGECFLQKVRDDRPEARAWDLADRSRRRLQIQYFTRDQIGSPTGTLIKRETDGSRWIDGLHFNSLDQLIEIQILLGQGQTLGSLSSAQNTIKREASVIMHMFADERLNQFHGNPWLFSAENDALDHLDMSALRKHSAKIRAAFLGAISTADGNIPESMKSFARSGSDDGTTDNSLRYYEINGGAVMVPLKGDEKIQFYQGGEAMNYAELLDDLLSNIVYAYKYPPEYLIKLANNGAGTNRLLLGKVRKAHARIRRMIQKQFVQGCWEFVIGDAMMPDGPLNKFASVKDWNQITCISEPDPSVDLGRDEKAEQEKIRTFTGTVEAYCDAQNRDGTEIRHQRLEEIADNISFGSAIRKPGVPNGLPWYLCVDPMTIQSITALAQTGSVTLEDLQKQFADAAASKP